MGNAKGNQQGVVEQGLARQTGLDSGSMDQLLQILAPMVMGALGKTQREQHLDASGVANFLGGQRQVAQDAAPDVMGLLGDLLDSNDDGSVIDDLGRLAGSLFGN